MSFQVFLRSYEQIRTFVALAARQSFDVQVCNDRQTINGKDFMGMCALDFSRPLKVHANCTGDEAVEFRKNVLALQN
ncbi:MAG: HPr family phosphocarrier protein [Oscillospiraceae bacterium]|nr:HPr family phosphocarrier protein [Oscillospiraceae bacterium]